MAMLVGLKVENVCAFEPNAQMELDGCPHCGNVHQVDVMLPEKCEKFTQLFICPDTSKMYQATFVPNE